LGFNSRLDSLQAVVLSAKLARLAGWNEDRRNAAARYREMLADLPAVTLPATMPGNTHVWHLYVVRVPRRDEALAAMHRAGIGAGVHYPVPVHLQGAFACLGHRRGDFPVSEEAGETMLSLPLFPQITESQQQQVAGLLAKVCG
ncbi:MAG TPA: DegT/DnrJ/EryC1/StrS family aminotransferase, partial [Actinomycetota bacterium]|nr:DegT/DnrJ/EryC1/StrS family aminotransferase [Actinomycetota bacterium]